MRRKPGQFGPSPRNPTPRRGGSRVLRTGPERGEPEPLSDPRQITARTMYRTPPKTSSAPSPMTIILASRFIAATNAPTTTRRNTATEPRSKREDGYSFQLPPPARLRLAWGRINEIYGDSAFSAIVLLARTFARSMPVNGPRKRPARLTQTECLLWSEQMEGFGVTCAAAAEMDA
jgi:hypothetical protein